MKILKFITILLLLIGCSENNNRTTEFDKILGKENSQTLDLLLSEFENDFLKRQYPELEKNKAYKKFVSEISLGETSHFVKISKKHKDLLTKNTLYHEIYCVMDSTWIEKNPWNDKTLLVKGRTKCLKLDGTYENGSMEMPFDEREISKDSIKKKYMTFVETNYTGKYLKALNSISGESDFLKSFVKDRNDFGIIPGEFIAKRMLTHNVDFDDYYIQRIIALELSY
ncbi:hypothetical protein [Seonamhaeicola maritimus]|uniref:Uncharacterized protein n=1 Tax=Seonamhaeicola maritimus TaxID=2591822 RepID=A0A5C7GF10_9FLAO|nr:hypothetical protein [Seonamhaeicola maritimus]TXG34852.1 hypothetical protein FUA22_17275 [Seonamhaeicola maritimus]